MTHVARLAETEETHPQEVTGRQECNCARRLSTESWARGGLADPRPTRALIRHVGRPYVPTRSNPRNSADTQQRSAAKPGRAAPPSALSSGGRVNAGQQMQIHPRRRSSAGKICLPARPDRRRPRAWGPLLSFAVHAAAVASPESSGPAGVGSISRVPREHDKLLPVVQYSIQVQTGHSTPVFVVLPLSSPSCSHTCAPPCLY